MIKWQAYKYCKLNSCHYLFFLTHHIEVQLLSPISWWNEISLHYQNSIHKLTGMAYMYHVRSTANIFRAYLFMSQFLRSSLSTMVQMCTRTQCSVVEAVLGSSKYYKFIVSKRSHKWNTKAVHGLKSFCLSCKAFSPITSFTRKIGRIRFL